MKKRTKSIAVALSLCFGLGWAISQVHAADLPVFQIVAKDGRLLPNRLEIPAGVKIKLTIQNAGNGPIEFENLDLRVEKVLAPGASSFLILRPLKPGVYRFFDDFHPNTSEMLIIAK